eukprot:16825-Heterococcus_DN1.PRE.1
MACCYGCITVLCNLGAQAYEGDCIVCAQSHYCCGSSCLRQGMQSVHRAIVDRLDTIAALR